MHSILVQPTQSEGFINLKTFVNFLFFLKIPTEMPLEQFEEKICSVRCSLITLEESAQVYSLLPWAGK
jgi:hypothetical protein